MKQFTTNQGTFLAVTLNIMFTELELIFDVWSGYLVYGNTQRYIKRKHRLIANGIVNDAIELPPIKWEVVGLLIDLKCRECDKIANVLYNQPFSNGVNEYYFFDGYFDRRYNSIACVIGEIKKIGLLNENYTNSDLGKILILKAK